MTDEINVKVVSLGPDRNLRLQYVDPVTEERKSKTAGTQDRDEARDLAIEWQTELRNGIAKSPSRVTWAEARERYETEHLARIAKGTREIYGVGLDMFERIINPCRLATVTASVISRFTAQRAKDSNKRTGHQISTNTLARDLRSLRAFLTWCHDIGLLTHLPKIKMPADLKGMKGRPITAEEFERMLSKVPKVKQTDSDQVVRLLHGLWLSGLRISEAIRLSWDCDTPISVDLSGKHPAIRFKRGSQKSKRGEVAPMTPDFGKFLLKIPESERTGRVFPVGMSDKRATRIISMVGEKAGVVVEREVIDDVEKVIYASSHDLRRTFGTRWARRVAPAVLQKLMRHKSINTTMKYYVDLDADDLTGSLWDSFGHIEASDTTLTPLAQETEKRETSQST